MCKNYSRSKIHKQVAKKRQANKNITLTEIVALREIKKVNKRLQMEYNYIKNQTDLAQPSIEYKKKNITQRKKGTTLKFKKKKKNIYYV